MSSLQLVWLSIVVSATSVFALFLRGGKRDVLPYLAAYFMFFGLGPAINFAGHQKIYHLIDIDDLGKASLGIALAIAGMAVTGLLLPANSQRTHPIETPNEPRQFPLVPVALFGLTAYALVVITLRGPEMLQVDKHARIALAGDWHYKFLLLQFFACSLYFVTRRRTVDRVAYWANLACYIAYCLATRERDFIFVIFALLLYRQARRRRGSLTVLGATAGAAILLATFLASMRSKKEFGVNSALNEGSVLIVDTFVVGLVPARVQYLMGQTYVDALLNLFPTFLVGERGSLSAWLLETVAPTSRSGWGFSLTAEAYLNFGPLAIPVVFGALTAIQRWLAARAPHGHFATYASILFTLVWMYNFRGESRAFIISMAGGLAFYGAVSLFSHPVATAHEPARARAGGRRTSPTRSGTDHHPPRRGPHAHPRVGRGGGVLDPPTPSRTPEPPLPVC